jgi:hypothetical protein
MSQIKSGAVSGAIFFNLNLNISEHSKTCVAWLTGSYSMAVMPSEEHPCVLTGNGNLTMWTVHMFYNSEKLGKINPRRKRSSINDFVTYSLI